MKPSTKRYLKLGILASLATQGCASTDTELSPTVGALHTISISSNDDVSEIPPMYSSVRDDATTVQAKSYLLYTDDDASYIALHFSSFDLPAECTMVISDVQGSPSNTSILTNKGRNGKGEFWARHVKSSLLGLTLKCTGENRAVLDGATFQIDKYAAGYPNDLTYFHEIPTAAPTAGPTSSPTNGPTSVPTFSPTEDPTAAPTSGPTSVPTSSRIEMSEVHSTPTRSELFNVPVNDGGNRKLKTVSNGLHRRRQRKRRKLGVCNGVDGRQSVSCSSSGVEEQSRGVARLLIAGRFVCSGFLVSENILVTTSLCFVDADEPLDADYEFEFQTQSCDSLNLARSEVFEAAELIEDNETSDYVIVRLHGNPGTKYGYLQVADEVPSIGDAVFVPQHKHGLDKQVAENCAVLTNGRHASDRTCSLGGAFKDISHGCDVDGAALGSPVISKVSGKVVGMHHCTGTCPGNFAIPGLELHNALIRVPQLRAELQTVSSAQCILSINTHDCPAVIHSSGLVREACDCANFCGGEFLGCCEKGEECAVECNDKLVAGCANRPPSLSHQNLVDNHIAIEEVNMQAPEPWFITEESGVTATEVSNSRTESHATDSTGKDYHRQLRIKR